MATPLKSASSSSIQEFTTAEENYLAYQIGLHLGEAGTSEVGSINKSGGQSVGSFSNTFFNEPVGTHPSTSITSGTTTTNVYQTSGTPAETDSDVYSPLMWVDSASQTGFKMMPDADLNDAIDRYLSTIFTNEYPGSYRLATSSPGGDWSVHISNAFSDTRTDGTSTQYNIYKKTSGTAPTTTRPLRLKNESSFEGVQEMTDRQIRYSFGQRAKARLLSSGSGIGSYQLRSSAQGSPTDAGTWVAKGTATDTKQTTSQQTFTRDSTVNFQANYVRAYTSQYATNYTKLRQIDYTRVSQINYTKPYSRAFTRLASESFTVPYEQSYLKAYGTGYVRGYTGTYTGAYTRRYSTPYDRAFVSQDEVNYTPNYATQYLATFTGNYQGTYDRAFNTPYVKSYTNNFNSVAYLTGYVPNYTGSFVGTFQNTFETSFNRRYTGVYTPNYIRAYAGTYTPNYVSNYVTNYVSNYVNNYDGATYARAYTQPYTGNFNRAYTNPYTRTFNAQYLFPYVRNYTLIYTSSYQNFYDRNFTGTFDRAYTPNYIVNYQKAYTKSYVHEVDVYYNPNYTSTFEVAYLRNYTSNYVRNYSSVYNLTYVPTYQRAFNSPYTRAFSAGYNRQFETAYQAPNYVGDYSVPYTGQGTVNTLYSRDYQRFFTVGSPTSKNIAYQTNFTPLYTRAFAGTVNYVAGYDRLGTNYSSIRAVQYSIRDEQYQLNDNLFAPVDGQATLFTPNGPNIYKPGDFGVSINAVAFRHISYTRLAGYESQASFLGGGLMNIIYTQENRGVYTNYYIGPIVLSGTPYIGLSEDNIYVSSYEGSGGYFLHPILNTAQYGLDGVPTFIYYSGPNIGDFYQNARAGIYIGSIGYTNYGPSNTFVQYQRLLTFLGSGSYSSNTIYSGAMKNVYIPGLNDPTDIYVLDTYASVPDVVNRGSYESLQYTGGGPRDYLSGLEGFARPIPNVYGPGPDYEGPPTFLGRASYASGSADLYLRASANRQPVYFQTVYIGGAYYTNNETSYVSPAYSRAFFNAFPEYIGEHPYVTHNYISGVNYTAPTSFRVYGAVYQVGYTGGFPEITYTGNVSYSGGFYQGVRFFAGSGALTNYLANYLGPPLFYIGGTATPILLYVTTAPTGLGGVPYTGPIFYESQTFAGPGPNYISEFASAASYSGQYSRLYSGFNIVASYERLFAQIGSPYDGAPYYERIYGNIYIRDFIGFYQRVTNAINYVRAYDISYTNTYTGGYDTGIRYYQKGYGVGGTFFSTFYTTLAGYDGPNYTITFQSAYANEFATFYVGTYTATFNPALAGQYLRQNVFIGYYDREVFNAQYTEPYQSPAYAGTYEGTYVRNFDAFYENTAYNISFYDRLYTMQYTTAYDIAYLVNYTTAYARNFVDAYTTNYTSTFSAGYQNEFATGYQNEFVGSVFETTFNAGYVGTAEVGYTTTYVGTYTSNYARNYTRQFIGPTYSADYVGTYTGAFDSPYTRTYSGTYEGPTYAGNYDLTNYTTTYVSPAYVGTYQNTYTGAYTNETDVAYARAFDGTVFEATYTKDYTSAYLINYIGQYTGIYTSIYTGAYNKVYTGTYTGDYTTDYIGNYENVYTRNFEDAYIQDYLGNFIGNFEGLTIDATDEDIETYTLYVRIA